MPTRRSKSQASQTSQEVTQVLVSQLCQLENILKSKEKQSYFLF